MTLIKFIYALFENNSIAAKNINPLSEKLYFIYLYTYLKFKKLIFYDLLKIKHGSFVIWGHTIYFPDFSLFEMIFIDIFIKRIEALETTNPSPKIFDCGANIGMSSFYFKIRYPKSRIICFEPARLAFSYLKKNLSQFENCIFINAALVGSNKKSTNLLTPKGSAKADIGSTVSKEVSDIRWKKLILRKEKVSTTTLSQYIKKGEVIDFIKLDIEGMEQEVLNNLVKSGKINKVKEMFVEYHHHEKNSYTDLVNLLTKNGFRLIPGGDVRPPLPRYKNEFYIAYFWAYRK